MFLRRSGRVFHSQHDFCFSFVVERRTLQRRHEERRAKPSETIDVSRLEFENLSTQVMANLNALRRIEHELRKIRAALERSPAEDKSAS